MLGGPIGTGRENSLMSEYSLKLGEAVLRSRTREGFSKLLAEHDRRPLPDTEVVEYARLINDASCNLLAIINDILDMSKIQSGHFRLDTHDVSLDEILESITAALRIPAATAGVKLVLQLDSGALTVRGDAAKLRQVFGNLIGNAIKFTSAGGSVAIDTEVERDGAIGVHVQDTGVGMDEDEVKVALSPFGQVDGTRTRWREGTGLGLPIAKALIELHGGSLSIASAKSVGTHVIVKLPPPGLVAFMRQDLGLQIGRA